MPDSSQNRLSDDVRDVESHPVRISSVAGAFKVEAKSLSQQPIGRTEEIKGGGNDGVGEQDTRKPKKNGVSIRPQSVCEMRDRDGWRLRILRRLAVHFVGNAVGILGRHTIARMAVVFEGVKFSEPGYASFSACPNDRSIVERSCGISSARRFAIDCSARRFAFNVTMENNFGIFIALMISGGLPVGDEEKVSGDCSVAGRLSGVGV